VSEVARRWQLSSQQVFGWHREVREGLLALPAGELVVGPPVPDFVPILAEPAVSAASLASAPEAAFVPAIEVEIAGAVVRVRPGMEAGLLTSVLGAVRASAGRVVQTQSSTVRFACGTKRSTLKGWAPARREGAAHVRCCQGCGGQQDASN